MTAPEDDALQAQLARFRADRLRFEGLPVKSVVEIMRDALEQVILSAEVQALEPTAEQGFQSVVAFLLGEIPGNGGFAPYEAKILGLAVHGLFSAATAKAKKDQAAENA
jgi:hypothetical protein